MNQRQRTRTMERMRQGKFSVLVATDVAARGIDIQTISHVINFDLPGNAEDYVHRIGRTGRAGAKGIAWSFASAKDIRLLKDIEHYTGQRMTAQAIPGLEPKAKPAFAPRPKSGFRQAAGNSKGPFRPTRRPKPDFKAKALAQQVRIFCMKSLIGQLQQQFANAIASAIPKSSHSQLKSRKALKRALVTISAIWR